MASRFQAVGLVASPSYPDSITWSEENLIAVASGSIVTILNPDSPFGHRGLIKVPGRDPLPIGTVKREDLPSGSLLPICLFRDRDPCVRSVSWSPVGMAPNSGCLLTICTTEGLVKIYRPPFCDYSAEWIEIVDISEILYRCLADIGFEAFESPPSEYSEQLAEEQGCAKDLQISVCQKTKRKRRNEPSKLVSSISEGHMSSERPKNANAGDSGLSTNADVQETRLSHLLEIQPAHTKENESRWRHLKSYSLSSKKINDPSLQLLTASQYSSYNAMLSSLVIDWSPLLRLPSGNCAEALHCASSFSLLAVGGKSGGISFFRVTAPQFYSVEEDHVIPTVVVIGLLQAHNTWVTAIKWLHSTDNSFNAELLLVSGASDGSIKIWTGSSQEFMKSSAVNQHHFVLLKEIISADSIPVSVLSITVPVQCPDELLLAVGRGSGSFEVWLCDRAHDKFETFGSYAAHDHTVTGLSWAFEGSCLYTCSQDNNMRCWKIWGDSIFEVPIPSSMPGQRSISDLPNAFFSCFGLAVSPGNVAIAMVRSFDVELLNPMYQARSLKAAVEYLWIGGLEQDNSSRPFPELTRVLFPGFSQKDSNTWKLNILLSLKQYEDSARPLVVWDIVTALLAFKRTAPKYVESILVEWLSVCYLGSNLLRASPETVLTRISRNYSRLSSRQLHLLNVVCRRVVLSDLKADDIISGTQDQLKTCAGDERVNLWVKLVLGSEGELRHRVVFFSLSALNFISPPSSSVTECWYPVGVAQMEKWVELVQEENQSESSALEFQSLKRRLQCWPKSDYSSEEQCGYCSASAPFESPEFAFCRGTSDSSSKDSEKHKLARCAASMQICPTTPLWFCICCHRWVSKLPPEPLFSMPGRLTDNSLHSSSYLRVASKPLCPFCGILLQRFQPDFLLSAVPV